MYRWVVFLHVASVLLFFFFHGASAAVALKIGRERDLERVRALLQLSNDPIVFSTTWGSMLLMLVTGVVAGFMGRWWGQGWIWSALVLLIAISVASWVLGTRHFNRLREAVGLPWFDGRRERKPGEPAEPEVLAAMLTSGRPGLLAGIGLGGIVIVTWLMMFKPF